MAHPGATYRLQLHAGFGFAAAAEVVPYLARLGVTHVYASPLLQATAGSAHGYDVTDPTRLSHELGGERGFALLRDALRSHGLGLLLDIVPNHMAASPANPWWRDLLQHGPASVFADFFDVTFEPPHSPLEGRLLLPVLGRHYSAALAAGELVVATQGDELVVRYYERAFPLDPRTWPQVLHGLPLGEALDAETLSLLRRLVDELEGVPERRRSEPEARDDRRRRTAGARAALARLLHDDGVRRALDRRLAELNRDHTALDRLLRAQPYRLAFWKSAREKLNYRRFFNISDLVGLRTEDRRVFDAAHELVLRLLREGAAEGLRVDHVDGLYDPLEYLERLRAEAPGAWIVVEKILAADEELPHEWPVEGTTGYEFLNAVNDLFVEPAGWEALDGVYRRFTGQRSGFAAIARNAKRRIARDLFPGELHALEHRLVWIAEHDRWACDVPLRELRRALVMVTACLPVYRTYTRGEALRAEDRERVEHAVREARRHAPTVSRRATDLVRRLLLGELPAGADPAIAEAWHAFVMSWQQVSGPITAKGVEDTALYLYARLAARNEVGSEPEHAPAELEEFHRFLAARARGWPHTMNATATHDTKRGEDVRARLDVLSELPAQWEERLGRWHELAAPLRPHIAGREVPERETELLLYQSLLGIYPTDGASDAELADRLAAYALKAAREAKAYTSWLAPNEDYETALTAFARGLLDHPEFLADFAPFAHRLAGWGAVNGLAQLALKLIAPGVPDLYQGCELWDLSLVDPDNRRPVDYDLRRRWLGELTAAEDRAATARELLAAWPDGRIKLWLAWHGLQLRRRHPDLFASGELVPLVAEGERAACVVAFARRHGERWAMVVAPRLVTRLGEPHELLAGEAAWGDTRLALPEGAPERWRNVLTGAAVDAPRIADLLDGLPVGLLTAPSPEGPRL